MMNSPTIMVFIYALLAFFSGYHVAHAGESQNELQHWKTFLIKTFPQYKAQKIRLLKQDREGLWGKRPICEGASELEKLEVEIFNTWVVRNLVSRPNPNVYIDIRRYRKNARADIYELLSRSRKHERESINPCISKANQVFLSWGAYVFDLTVSCAGNTIFPDLLRTLVEALRHRDASVAMPKKVVYSPCGHMRYDTLELTAIIDRK